MKHMPNKNQRRKDKTPPAICLLRGISDFSWEAKNRKRNQKTKSQLHFNLPCELNSVYQVCEFLLAWTEIKEFCCFSSHSDINWACEVRLNYVFKVFILPVHFSECYVRMSGADKALLLFGFWEHRLLSFCLSENSAKTECIMSDWKGITQTKLIYWCELDAEKLWQDSLSLAADNSCSAVSVNCGITGQQLASQT